MSLQTDAAWEVHLFLGEIGAPYAIIGGLAVQFWGEPRFTQDVDVTVMTPLGSTQVFVEQLLTRFSARILDAAIFARRNRVILVRASNGCPIDISLGLPGYEQAVMERAVMTEIAPGQSVRICSAEDLVIHKSVAGRPQDLRDIEGVIYRQGSLLNAGYIRSWLRQFGEILETPDVEARFEQIWRRARAR